MKVEQKLFENTQYETHAETYMDIDSAFSVITHIHLGESKFLMGTPETLPDKISDYLLKFVGAK